LGTRNMTVDTAEEYIPMYEISRHQDSLRIGNCPGPEALLRNRFHTLESTIARRIQHNSHLLPRKAVIWKNCPNCPDCPVAALRKSLLERAGAMQAHKPGRNKVMVWTKDGRTVTLAVEEQR